MSYYDEASLMLLASGGAQKDGKAYSIKPTDGTGDFTFTRGSNLSATRVNASQLIEKGRENLLLQSNQFDTTWINARSTETSGQSGYDGTSDAWLLESTATATSSYLKQNISNSGVYTISVYAKAGTSGWMTINTSGNQNAYFDLQNGVLGSKSSNVIDSSIESIGSGWHRCSATLANYNDTYFFIANGNNNPITNSGDNIYIQDSQLEQGLVATDYIETGASTAQAGILENTPRFDYSGGASCPSLLLEPSRINLFPYSEYINGSDWALVGTATTKTENAITSPEGVVNGIKLIGSSNADNNGVAESFTISAGAEAFSVFAKAGEIDILQIGFGGTFSDTYGNVNLTSGELEVESGQTTTIEPFADGWYRITCVATATAGAGYWFVNIGDDPAMVRNGDYIGNGTDGLYVYGFQTEYGSYPTSYIPTYGVSQTRAQDDCRESSATSLIGQTEGTIYWEGSIVSVPGQGANIASFNYSTSSSISLERQPNKTIRARIWSNGAVVNIVTLGIGYDGNVKIAFAYKSGDTTLYINGVQIGTSSTAFAFGSALTEFNLGAGDVWFAYPHKSEVKEALLFKTRLSNADCETLTT